VITSVLVANRGEIALRVFRTCRRLGLYTVAVYSDADADAPHVEDADVAFRLPGSSPSETYLRGEKIVDAARRAGADAVHPGYGFLSENAGFARAVLDAGLTWVGPSPEAIDAMGSKVGSKRLMAAAGVPVLESLTPESITSEDLPVLAKASAGGGGRGMRIVEHLADLKGEIDAARREAGSAFGDPTVFCERYLPTGRHIEVQIMADALGTVWAVGERECSIQRRHQKVIEEAPSPLVERIDGMRERLFAAARAAAAAVAYTGAGTVEFLADERGAFYFLEMNTRSQVEHPVTECTTGLDLVALQLQIADGVALAAQPPPTHGHSIEARIYAEDPAANWQPQSGTLRTFEVPDVVVAFGTDPSTAGVRLDSGVADGYEVGIHYDAMLAKVISWSPTRTQAATALARTLARSRIHGLRTNRDLLVNVLRHPAFLAGDTHTGFFDQHGLASLAAGLDADAEPVFALAAALALDAARRAEAPVLPGVRSGWRNVVSQPQRVELDGPGGRHDVRFRLGRGGLVAGDFDGVELVRAAGDEVVLAVDGARRRYEVARHGDDVYVDAAHGSVHLAVVGRFTDPEDLVAPGSLLAPLPGSVVRIDASVGDEVSVGKPMILLEAMKMQHRIEAPATGTVTEICVKEGEQVKLGAVLAVVQPREAAGHDQP
jgi:propionyl-CoA carboxylase alpha chain